MEQKKIKFFGRIGRSLIGRSSIESDLLDTVEETLLCADVGLDTTSQIVQGLQKRVRTDKYIGKEQLMQLLKEEMMDCFPTVDAETPFPIANQPHIILLVGVNGTGKTTTAARLGHAYQLRGNSVVLGAADTFRAAAVSQLKRWADRLHIEIVSKETGADPNAVAYATVQHASETKTQVAIIDTAGRLHNKKTLMDELTKVHRVLGKALPSAPHEVLLVLDANTGQNAFLQAEAFLAATKVTGLVLTKLDGTAKGGVLLGIAAKYRIPIRYVGVGEGVEDLQPFVKSHYIDALLGAS